jgi:large subunit ribosomal protein L16
MKFRKYFKIKYSGNNALQHDKIHFGSIALKSLEHCNLTNEQLISAIKSIKRVIKKKNFLIIKVLPFWSLTRKPRDVRMGRGKGNPTLKVFPLKAGKILFEVKGVDDDIAIKAFKYSSIRLPVLTKIIKKYDKRTDNIEGSW